MTFVMSAMTATATAWSPPPVQFYQATAAALPVLMIAVVYQSKAFDPDQSSNRGWKAAAAIAWMVSFAATIGGVGASLAGIAEPTPGNTLVAIWSLSACPFFLMLGEGSRRAFARQRQDDEKRWTRAWWHRQNSLFIEALVLSSVPGVALLIALRTVHQAVLP